MAVVTFDFTGAPPEQGGFGSDHVPPGKYLLKIVEAIDKPSKTGKRMFTVNYETVGPIAGKKLVDRFVLDQPGSFGFKRLHTMILALGTTVGERSISLDTDQLSGRQCIAQVSDEMQEANGDYPARIVSRIDLYFTVQGIRPDQPTQVQAQAPSIPLAASPLTPPVQVAPPPVAMPAPIDNGFGQTVAAPIAPTVASTQAAGIAEAVDALFG